MNEIDDIKDMTPKGDAQDAALPSGEVFHEYGIVDVTACFPAEEYEWVTELEGTEKHVVVPCRVVARGFNSLRSARRLIETSDEYDPESACRVVQVQDSRGR